MISLFITTNKQTLVGKKNTQKHKKILLVFIQILFYFLLTFRIHKRRVKKSYAPLFFISCCCCCSLGYGKAPTTTSLSSMHSCSSRAHSQRHFERAAQLHTQAGRECLKGKESLKSVRQRPIIRQCVFVFVCERERKRESNRNATKLQLRVRQKTGRESL